MFEAKAAKALWDPDQREYGVRLEVPKILGRLPLARFWAQGEATVTPCTMRDTVCAQAKANAVEMRASRESGVPLP